MSLSVRVRFEVLKRDRYTCGYCGKHPPDVLLEVDHIVPVAAGGTDDLVNLVTACWDCNRGKSDRLLEEGTAPVPLPADDIAARISEMEERITQAREYMAVLGRVDELRAEQHDLVIARWAAAWGGGLTEDGAAYRMPEGGYWPDDRSLKAILRRLPVVDVLEAVDIAAGRFPNKASYDATRYFYGVCWRIVREREA